MAVGCNRIRWLIFKYCVSLDFLEGAVRGPTLNVCFWRDVGLRGWKIVKHVNV